MSWVSITPFGVPVVPLVNTSSNVSSGVGRFQAAWRASQSGGNSGSSSAGSSDRASTAVVGKSAEAGLARVGGVAARAEDEVPRARCPDDHLDRVGGHPQVERDEDRAERASRRSRQPAALGVDGLQVRIRSPGSRSSARNRHAAMRARRSSSR